MIIDTIEKTISDYVNLGIPREKILFSQNPTFLFSLDRKCIVDGYDGYDELSSLKIVDNKIINNIFLFCLIYSEIDDERLKNILEEDYVIVTPCDGGYRYCTVSLPKTTNMNPLKSCIEIAKKSTCKRFKCGSVIINENKIIGIGYNSQPCNINEECFKDSLAKDFKSDKTCCVHAEQRAIMNALKMNPSRLEGSTLYFIRLNDSSEPFLAGEPYCTICSKMALDVGIKEFCLWKENGWKHYDTKEYNELSFKFKENA